MWGFRLFRIGNPYDERDRRNDVDDSVENQIATLVLKQSRRTSEKHSQSGDERVGEQILLQDESDYEPQQKRARQCRQQHERRFGESRVWLKQRTKQQRDRRADRKSTRLNSSHSQISYAVFC